MGTPSSGSRASPLPLTLTGCLVQHRASSTDNHTTKHKPSHHNKLAEPPPAPKNPWAYDAAFPDQYEHQLNIVQTHARSLLKNTKPNSDSFIQTMWHVSDYNAMESLQLQTLGIEDDEDARDQQVVMPQDPSRTISFNERQSSMLQQYHQRIRPGQGPDGTPTPSFARPDAVHNPQIEQPRHTPQAENIPFPPPSSATMSPPPTKISLPKSENEALPVQRPNGNQSSAPKALISMSTQQSRPAALAPPIWCEENFVKFLQSQNARPPNSQHRQNRVNRPPAESAPPQQARQKPPPKLAHARLLFSEHMRQHHHQALRLKEALRQPDLVGPNTAKTIQNARAQPELYQSPCPEPASPPRRRRVGMKTVPGYAQLAAQQPLSQQGRWPLGKKTVPGTQRGAPVADEGSPSAGVDLSPHMTALSMSPTQQAQPYQPAQDAPVLNGPLSYLDQIKVQFADQPDVYKRFLDIMRAFKSDT